MTISPRLAGALLSCLVSLATTAAPADTSETAEAEQPEETLIVTAHRVPTSQSVPLVHVIDATELERRAALAGPDGIAHLPSLNLSRTGAFGGMAQARVRGAEANHLKVLVDGLELNDPATGSEYDFAHLDLTGISQIEFLPGAQSALWGSDALSGVVNLRTVPLAATRSVAVTGGSFDSYNARVELADRGQQGYYNLALSHYTTDGTNHALSGGEDDGYDNRTLQLGGGLTGERVRLDALLRQTRAESDIDPAPFPGFVPVDGDNRNDHDSTAGKIGIDVTLLEDRWSMAATAAWYRSDNAAFAAGQKTSETEGERLQLSLLQRLDLREGHTLNALIEWEREQFEQRAPASFFGNPNQDQSVTTESVALEHIGTWHRLHSALSVRFDHNSDFDDAVSYRLALRFTLTETWQLLLQTGTSVKDPTFFERFGFTPDTFLGNDQLDPERNRHASIGFAATRPGLAATLVYFDDRLTDEIDGFVPSATPGVFTAANLSEESERQGVEGTLKLSRGGFDLEATYTYLDSRDPAGVFEQRRPRHSGSLRLGTRIFQDRGYAEVGTIYTGTQRDTNFGSFQPVLLSSYHRAHVAFNLALTESWRIGGRVENALDDDTQDVFGYRPPKRSFFATLRWQP